MNTPKGTWHLLGYLLFAELLVSAVVDDDVLAILSGESVLAARDGPFSADPFSPAALRLTAFANIFVSTIVHHGGLALDSAPVITFALGYGALATYPLLLAVYALSGGRI
jgi:hypothetical protein